ncbi:hypothetical protein DENSPDRAFT_90695 [Dentipellis sp. KUC8613]|nr:hypothetical protein DENSPDRAFT_90695 [Dentipellis sp. KUC8613]
MLPSAHPERWAHRLRLQPGGATCPRVHAASRTARRLHDGFLPARRWLLCSSCVWKDPAYHAHWRAGSIVPAESGLHSDPGEGKGEGELLMEEGEEA